MVLICPSCCKNNEPSASFCNYCGASLAGPPIAATYSPPETDITIPAVAPTGPNQSTVFYIGMAVILLCGILVLISSFMPWITDGRKVSGVHISGWDVSKIMDDDFFSFDEGKPLFSGYLSFGFGALIVLSGVFLVFKRTKSSSEAALVVSSATLAIALANTYSITSFYELDGSPSFSLEGGMILFLAASIGAAVGSIMCLVETSRWKKETHNPQP